MRSESLARAGRGWGPSVRVAPVARSVQEDADESGPEPRRLVRACLSRPSPRAPEWWRPREGLVAAGLAPLSVRRGARAARCAEPRETEGAEAVVTVARVLRAPHEVAGALPPSRPLAQPSESGRAVAFRAARLPPDLGAGEPWF